MLTLSVDTDLYLVSSLQFDNDVVSDALWVEGVGHPDGQGQGARLGAGVPHLGGVKA